MSKSLEGKIKHRFYDKNEHVKIDKFVTIGIRTRKQGNYPYLMNSESLFPDPLLDNAGRLARGRAVQDSTVGLALRFFLPGAAAARAAISL